MKGRSGSWAGTSSTFFFMSFVRKDFDGDVSLVRFQKDTWEGRRKPKLLGLDGKFSLRALRASAIRSHEYRDTGPRF